MLLEYLKRPKIVISKLKFNNLKNTLSLELKTLNLKIQSCFLKHTDSWNEK